MGLINHIQYMIASRPDQDPSAKPSLEFEERAGVTGVSTRYDYPCVQGRTRAAFNHWAGIFCGFQNKDTSRQTRLLQRTWNSLVDINPELEKIEPEDHPTRLRHGIFGVISDYNPDDIDFFIDMAKHTQDGPTGYLLYEVPSYARLDCEIYLRSGIGKGWVAAPKTLTRIFEQMKDRPRLQEREIDWVLSTPPLSRWDRVTQEQIDATRYFVTPLVQKDGPML